ncbi:MAG: sugar ABC transporter permease [Spirochaetes bacterium]|nr:sugar ABC transporter permease [Spirochaetota bacterium]
MINKDRGIRYVAPALAVLLLITAYPVFYVLYLSLHRELLIFKISKFIGPDNFFFLFQDDRFWNALKNTVYFSTLSVSVELALGLCIALLLNRSFRLKGVTRAVVLLPWAIPTVVSARMWELIFNSDFGVLNYLLGAHINWLGSPSWAIHAAILVDIWKTTPFVVILLTAGLQIIPGELYRAARTDGAGAWKVFRTITLPLLLPVILVVLLFRTLDAFRVFDVIYVLTGGGPANATETLSLYAYKILFQTLQFGYGSAISVMVFVCTGCISVFYIKLMTGSTPR